MGLVLEDFTQDLDDILAGKQPKKRPLAVPDDKVRSILDRMRGATSGQESSGSSTITNPDSGATGEFQVMPDNIPRWTQKYLKRPYTVDEFKKDRNAQVQVFNGEMGRYLTKALQKSGGDEEKAIRMAAAAWYGGEGAMNRYDDDRPQITKGKKYPSFREYTSSVLNRTKSATPVKNGFADFLAGLDKIVPPQAQETNPLDDFTKGLDEIIPIQAQPVQTQPMPVPTVPATVEVPPLVPDTPRPEPRKVTFSLGGITDAERGDSVPLPLEAEQQYQEYLKTTDQPVSREDFAAAVRDVPAIPKAQVSSTQYTVQGSKSPQQLVASVSPTAAQQPVSNTATPQSGSPLERQISIPKGMSVRAALREATIKMVAEAGLQVEAQDVEAALKEFPIKVDDRAATDTELEEIAESQNRQITHVINKDFLNAALAAKEKRIARQNVIRSKVTERVSKGDELSPADWEELGSQGIYEKDFAKQLDEARIQGAENREKLKGLVAANEKSTDTMVRLNPQLFAKSDFKVISQDEFNKELELARGYYNYLYDEEKKRANVYTLGTENGLPILTGNAKKNVEEKYQETIKEYGSISNYVREQERRKEEYQYRPLAAGLETAKTVGRRLAKIPSVLIDTAALASDINPLNWLSDAATKGEVSKMADSWRSAAEGWRKSVDESFLAQNPDLKEDWVVNDLADTAAQLAEQYILAIPTGGASLVLPFAEAATSQYSEAQKSGADKKTRLAAAVLGGVLAIPDVLLKAKYFRFLTPAGRETWVSNFAQRLFGGLKGKVGEAEAKVLTQSVLSSFAKNGAKNFAAEFTQEYIEDVGNKLFASQTYKPELTTKEIFRPTKKEIRGYLAAGASGLLGAGVEIALEQAQQGNTELALEGLNNALDKKEITQEQYDGLVAELKPVFRSSEGKTVKPKQGLNPLAENPTLQQLKKDLKEKETTQPSKDIFSWYDGETYRKATVPPEMRESVAELKRLEKDRNKLLDKWYEESGARKSKIGSDESNVALNSRPDLEAEYRKAENAWVEKYDEVVSKFEDNVAETPKTVTEPPIYDTEVPQPENKDALVEETIKSASQVENVAEKSIDENVENDFYETRAGERVFLTSEMPQTWNDWSETTQTLETQYIGAPWRGNTRDTWKTPNGTILYEETIQPEGRWSTDEPHTSTIIDFALPKTKETRRLAKNLKGELEEAPYSTGTFLLRLNGKDSLKRAFEFVETSKKQLFQLAESNKAKINEPNLFSANKIITSDKVQKARELLKKKGTQFNTGFDPEELGALTTIGAAYVEAGARKFADFSKKMVSDLGEAIKPHLQKIYDAIRNEHKFEGMGQVKKRSLPKTLREAGIEAEDQFYKVFGDAEAREIADKKINNFGLEATVKELESKTFYDKADAVASIKVQRALQNEARKAESEGDAEYAKELRTRSLELGAKHAELATQAGQFNQAAAMLAITADGVIYRANKILDGKDMPTSTYETFESLGLQGENQFNDLEICQKEIASLKKRIEELEKGVRPLERYSRSVIQRAKSVLPDMAELRTRIKETLKSTLDPQAGAVVIRPAKPFEKTPDDIKQYGALLLLDKPLGEIRRSDFYREMERTFGVRIKDQLPQIFADSVQFRGELLKNARAEMQTEKLKREFPDASESELQGIAEQREKEREIKQQTRGLAQTLANLYSPRRAKQTERLINIAREIAESEEIADYAERVLTKSSTQEDLSRANRQTYRAAQRLIEQAKVELQTEKDSLRAEILAGEDNLKTLEREEYLKRQEIKKTVAELARAYRRLEESTGKFYTKEALKIAGEARSILASGDLSGSLRQGFYYSVTNPLLMAKGSSDISGAFTGMVKSFSEAKHADLIVQIENNPHFDTMQRMGVEFADAGTSFSGLTSAEEMIRTEYAKKLPILKQWLGWSERTYSGFLDLQRALIAEDVIKELESQGLTYKTAKKEYDAAGVLINVATGRGDLTSNRQLNDAINSFGRALFAPRYAVSRFQLLNHLLNPVALKNLPSATRRIALKRAMRFHIAVSLPLLAAGMMGLVSLDPDDDDFLKIRLGTKARYETTGGLQSYLRYVGQMGKGLYKWGRGEKGKGFFRIQENFWDKKLNPPLSYLNAWRKGKEVDQTEFNWLTGITNRLQPITFREFYKNTSEDGVLGFVATLPAIAGIGLSYYPDRTVKAIQKEINNLKLPPNATKEEREKYRKKLLALRRQLAEKQKEERPK